MIKKVRKYFIAGLLTVLPLFISIYILVFLFRFVDGILGNIINVYFKKTWGFYVPGLGLILFLLTVLFTGFLSSFFIGRLLQKNLERFIQQFPILRVIYPPLKQIFEFLFSKESIGFKKAVLIEYPRKGSWTLGFITNETFKEACDKAQSQLLSILVPFVPNPTSGFVVFVPPDEIVFLDISIKDALKVVISGGLLNPEDLPK